MFSPCRPSLALISLATLLVLPRCGEELLPAVDAALYDGGDLGKALDPDPRGSPQIDGNPGTRAFSFVVFGDTHPPADDCLSPLATPELRAFPLAIKGLDPDFLLHVGDLVDMGRVPGAYDQFERCYSLLLQSFPLFPTAGNHDVDWNLGAPSYRRYLERQLFTLNPAVGGRGYPLAFPLTYRDDPARYSDDPKKPVYGGGKLPSGFTFKTYYAFRHRNAYFISFEQTTRWEINTPRPWVEAQLKKARSTPGVRHLFVYMHSPMYSTFKEELGSGDSLLPMRQPYEALFRKYDVTMVFSGHIHAYDRFIVPDDGKMTRASPPPVRYAHDGKGVHYLVLGPAGANYLPNKCAPIPPPREERSYGYLQARGCGHNMVRVMVRGKHLEVEVLGVKGGPADYKVSTWDAFNIE